MFQIDDDQAVPDEPALPTDFIGQPGWFTGAITALGVKATRIRGYWLNMVQRELMNILAAVGMPMVKGVNNQVILAIQQLIVGAGRWKTFSAAGSYSFVVPAGVYWIYVSVVGGGGGGGACKAVQGSLTGAAFGSGAGAGGQAIGIYAVTPGQMFTVIVGAGGQSQAVGGTTAFGSLLAATGGQPGQFTDGGNSPGGGGGQGVGGTIGNYGGGCGSDGQTTGAAGIVLMAGNGADGPYGGGGRAGSRQAVPGNAPGAGGGGVNDSSGSNTFYVGAAGHDGEVLVRF